MRLEVIIREEGESERLESISASGLVVKGPEEVELTGWGLSLVWVEGPPCSQEPLVDLGHVRKALSSHIGQGGLPSHWDAEEIVGVWLEREKMLA